MSSLTIHDQILYSTIRLECEYLGDPEKAGVGTGYVFNFLDNGDNSLPGIVTNRHVLEGAETVKFLVHVKGADGKPVSGPGHAITVENAERFVVFHPDPDVDLATFMFQPVIRRLQELGVDPFYRSIPPAIVPTVAELEQLLPLEEVVMVGYPTGMWDRAHNFPIIRRGTTATHPAKPFDGNPEFLADIFCIEGSSGSPVFLLNTGAYVDRSGTHLGGTRFMLLGTLWGGHTESRDGEIVRVPIPQSHRLRSKTQLPINLGVVVQATELGPLEDAVKEFLAKHGGSGRPAIRRG